MINWKKLSLKQMDELHLYQEDTEVTLVDPTADPKSMTFFMFEAEKVFSEKQLGKYKNVTPTEFKIVKEKLLELGEYLGGEDDS